MNLRVVRWEQDAPKRVDGDPNGAFRRMAAAASVTVVLLRNDLRPGTKEEIREALKAPKVQVSALWLAPDHLRSKPTRDLEAYLNRKKQRFIWERTGVPGSREVSASMVKIIARVVGELWASGAADGQESEAYREALGL